RSGIEALSPERGLALFDTADRLDEALLVPIGLDLAALRPLAQMGVLPAMLRGLVRVPKRRGAGGGSLARRLAGLPESERDQAVLDLVRAHVAAVLGHAGAAAVDVEATFKDLGFDSLAAVELRNRLSQATGVKLPATVVFDHPTPVAVAGYLRARVEGVQEGGGAVAARRRSADDEPIAIVGMAARFPGGVSSPDDLWDLVADGSDAIGGLPTNRGWDLDRLYDPDPAVPWTSYARDGGFIHDADEFDAAFFGIGPREALAMDPQQRLMLEASWEAIEAAGIDPTSLRGSDTGVFAGVMYHDYGLGMGPLSADLEGYIGTGVAGSVFSGRVAYTFGLEGPALTLDTACSSSLVALHLACQALRAGECSMALAGGATVLASPGPLTYFSRQRALAPDSRCKPFAAAADGIGMSEGVGLLLVERLSDARRLGHDVLALVRGSAVNQDGASNGLTAPNGPAQERVIRQALADAGVGTADVDVVEAHGTGTVLGDPIEAQALLATYGQDRDGRPLRLGSIKSNIGHTQAAAGVAGVMKMVLALRAGRLPATLHVDEPSPHVDWDAGAVELLTEAVDWRPREGRARRAGVSSFGISGTNAHVIVEEAPAAARPAAHDASPDGGTRDAAAGGVVLPWPVSAKSRAGLRGQATRLAELVAGRDGLDPLAVGRSLALGRTAFDERAVVLGDGREQLLAGVSALADGEPSGSVVEGLAVGGGAVAFVFPGQGSQWQGMAVELWDSSPPFAERMRACAAALEPHLGWSLEDALRAADGAPALERVDVVQPVLFAVYVSIAALWRHYGVEPSVVVGHSQGEIAAAQVAGMLSLEDAARVVAVRSLALAELSGDGWMVSIAASEADVLRILERWDGQIGIAALNGPLSIVVSGPSGTVEELLDACAADGVRARRIPVDYAAHSVEVEAVRDRLLGELASIEPRSGSMTLLSTVTGEAIDGTELDAGYWYRNLREPVRFEQAIRDLIDQGLGVFVEASPHPVVATAVSETAEDAGRAVTVVGSLRRDEGGLGRFARSLAEAWVGGAKVGWDRFFEGAGRVGLPTYAFERQRFWLEGQAGAGDVTGAGLLDGDHPLLGASIAVAGGEEWLFSGRLSVGGQGWLADHAVFETVLLPGSGFVELVLHAGAQTGCEVLEELTLEAPLVFDGTHGAAVQVRLGEPDDQGRRDVAVHSRREVAADGERDADGEWVRHASGAVRPGGELDAVAAELEGSWPPAGAEPVDVEDVYDRLAGAGFGYGPAFQGLRAAWHRGGEVFAEVELDEGQAREAGRFGLHPALLDSALHGVFLGGLEGLAGEGVRLPFAWSDVRLHATAGVSALRVRLAAVDGAIELAATDEQGQPVVSVGRLAVRPADPAALRAAVGGRAADDSLLGVDWIEVEVDRDAAEADVEVVRLADLVEGDDGVVASVHGTAADVLRLLREWVGEERPDAQRLVLVTERAVGLPGDGVGPDVVAGAVWGLVRSAQAEHPG
ncbi:MAG TPA: beta-ketoacyl synthase N-terminal-like domain-containing protein, partial [Solirubrobacteraceae bacterium]|nr:beta-ketoacyl synthase N-terminal-like domain-containing protein [Solirubrobacteraceae bacterium]